MDKNKEEEAAIQRAEQAFSERRGYYSLEMTASIVAESKNVPLRSGQPSYLIWAKAVSARERGWRVSGGLTRPKDDFAIPVRELQREENSFVYLSDFIEWAIEAGCTIAPSAVKEARQECEVSDTFEHRVRLWEIERTRAELRNSKTQKTEVIMARDDHLAELDRERNEIISLLRSENPSLSGGTSAPPSPVGEPCIPCPPTNKDDWYLIIRAAARLFHAKHGRCPETKAEIWDWLNSKPPIGYRITSGQDEYGKKELSSADGGSLGKRSFGGRWDRYTCGTKEHNET